MIYCEILNCRVCKGQLESVLDLGTQCLGGQFPKEGEPDSPKAPLHLMRCATCGLAQLGHTVEPELMFRDYGYRSGVTATMREHLAGMAEEAVRLFGRSIGNYSNALDIGCNDGELLMRLPLGWMRYGIDPADVETPPLVRRFKGFFPQDMPPPDTGWFGLIFTVACFYDADDPVGFAKAVADRLAPGGLWCVEVADAITMTTYGVWDSVCHEHLCYYEPATLEEAVRRAGLYVRHWSYSACNGGSLRFYASKEDAPRRFASSVDAAQWDYFAGNVKRSICNIGDWLYQNRAKRIHLLGASTKANTWLQAIGPTAAVIQAASDRDPRKIGRRTPGTGIPIISEEESRAMKPDVYVVGPWHFRNEIVERESEFLSRGGKLVFPLPRLEEVGA